MSDFEQRLGASIKNLAEHPRTGPAPERRRQRAVGLAAASALVATTIGAVFVFGATIGRSSTEEPPAFAANEQPSQFEVDEVAEDIGARLRDRDGYGGTAVDYDAGTVTVSWRGTAPTELDESLGERDSGVVVNVRLVPFSIAELMAAAERAREFGGRLAADPSLRFGIIGFLPDRSGLQVTAERPEGIPVDELEAYVGMPVEIVKGLPPEPAKLK